MILWSKSDERTMVIKEERHGNYPKRCHSLTSYCMTDDEIFFMGGG